MSNVEVQYIDHLGSDSLVVDAARVSHNKRAENYSKERNDRLIAYLAKHGHIMPFAHPTVVLRINAPIFTARQLGKSTVGFVWSEISKRYIDTTPDFWVP